ncbi:type II toxin-antitoxin system VapB family antitoxin [Tianweitania sp. BSSL-BM11]|uniref:Type II toxin-antitoxin system VapB family antitoxin n=1 Tax=Tianweitania aestuarii TaxID=2814886 RepID=A0ABS5RXJ4_9HYPH|nr:type II toxin-antitoxin system VapB family antitoxin [Tianweitania aestuarii]MBS9721751.1 type II toxin-antitoxin system VapB family antitoxin [Tianweitania aestuarii]
MAEPYLSGRSSKAHDLAHRLAKRENRSITDIVERALEAYEMREAPRETAEAFYARLKALASTDIDLDELIRESHRLYCESSTHSNGAEI